MTTQAQIGATRFQQQQIARFLTDTSRFIVTSWADNIYNVYTPGTADRVFSGTADEVLGFLERQK
jgi:hypothetical protein